MKNWFVRLALMLSVVVMVTSAMAQTGGSILRGQVVDEVNAIIPGAKVTIVLPGGKKREVVADANGEFVIPNVAPGIYNFYIQFQGFKPFVIPDLKMPQDVPLKATMIIGDVEIATDVTDNLNGANVEPDQNLSATVLGEDFIKDLPNNEDDLRDVLQALAGPGAGAAGGGQGGGAEIMVNGFGGGRLPPKEAIMRITINQNPFSAEFSQPGFGRIEIQTKPGNDNWRGTIGTSYRNSALDARNAFATTKPDLNQQQYSFNISGPLIKKKMSIFAFAERRSLEGGSTTTYTSPLARVAENVLAPNASTMFSVRTDYLVNQKNTLGVNYFRSQRNSTNQEFAVSFGGGFGFGGGPGGGGGGGGRGGGGASGAVNFTKPERGTNSTSASNDMQIIFTSILSSRLINEARLRMGYDTRNSTPRTSGVAINVLDAFNGGGAPGGISNTRGFDSEIQDYLTYTLKKHTLKGGVQMQYVKQYSNSPSNFNGTYTFPSLLQYCTAAEILAACPAGQSSSGRGIYQFTLNTGNPLLRYSQQEFSWFINDDFRLNPNLTLSFGLRHEFQNNLGDKNNFAPRLGIAWSPFKDRKTTFRSGAGVFYQRLNESIYATGLRFDGVTQQSWVIQNPTKFIANFTPGNDPLAALNALGVASQQNSVIRRLDPNMKAPSSYNVNASVERQLPLGLTTSVNFIYSRSVHQFRTRNTNARDGNLLVPRNLLPTEIDKTRPNPAQGDIFLIESSANSQFKALAVQLNRRTGKYFSFFANYSYSTVYNDSEGTMTAPANNLDLRGEWGPMMKGHQFFLMSRIALPKGINFNPMLSLRSGSPFNITVGQDVNRDNNFNDRPIGITRNSDLPVSAYSQFSSICRVSTGTTCTQTYSAFLTQFYPNGVKAIGPGSVGLNLNVSKVFGFGKRKDAPNAAGNGGPGGGGGGRGGDGGGRGGGGGMMGGPGMMGGMGGGPGGGGGMRGGGFGGGAEGTRYSLQVQAQITNVLNHVNYGQYSGTLTSPYFGISNNAAAGRQFELSMRFSF